MVNLDGDAEGGGLTQCPRGVELPVLLGLKHHRGQLAAADVDDHGEGDRVFDQMAVREQSAAGRGVGRDEVQELTGTPAQDQRGPLSSCQRPTWTPSNTPISRTLVTSQSSSVSSLTARPTQARAEVTSSPFTMPRSQGGVLPDCDPWRAGSGRCRGAA